MNIRNDDGSICERKMFSIVGAIFVVYGSDFLNLSDDEQRRILNSECVDVDSISDVKFKAFLKLKELLYEYS